jgi:glucose/arabinose dehydrogenase
MRGTTLGVLVLGFAFGCGGGNNPGGDGPPPGDDAPPQPDSNPDIPDAPMATCTQVSGTNVGLEALPGLDSAVADMPILVTSPTGDRRLFVVNKSGIIQIYVDGAMLPTPFLDIRDNNGGPVESGGEAGLLGLAFHPDFATNHKFYVFYDTAGAASEDLAEYQVSAGDPNVADVSTARMMMSIPDQASNHNGGMLEFGSDDYLYISVGDGGPQEDPENDAQNLNSLLGKVLRIDVDGTGAGPFNAYAIPTDNPFAVSGGAPEIFMYGMRNPWRWSFDRANGNMYVGDVGQNTIEEVTVLTPAEQNGADLGWRECEGTNDHIGGSGCNTQSGVRYPPQSQHTHASGWNAVIGGQVYRGSCFPDLVGTYFYSDNGASELWAFDYSGGAAQNDHDIGISLPGSPASLHADAFGELYLTTSDTGAIRHIVAQ